jgi:hypothetical protein
MNRNNASRRDEMRISNRIKSVAIALVAVLSFFGTLGAAKAADGDRVMYVGTYTSGSGQRHLCLPLPKLHRQADADRAGRRILQPGRAGP